MNDTARLNQIRRHLDAIAPGEWSLAGDAEGMFVEAQGPMGELSPLLRFHPGASGDEMQFAASAPQTVRFLLDLVDRAIARLRPPPPRRDNAPVADVFAIAARHNVPANPLYRIGARRVGCFPCINCSKEELEIVARLFPEQIERLAEWERIVSEACKRGYATFFAIVNDPVMAEEWERLEAAGEAVARFNLEQFGVRRMVEWAKTDRGGRQFPLFGREPSLACNQWGACE